jgi:hypothetical protein
MQAAKRSQAPLPSQVQTTLRDLSKFTKYKVKVIFMYLRIFFILYFCLKVNDDSIILDRTVADQVSMWKSNRGLTDDELVNGHVCSGNTCSYTKIGDVFICEKTGRVHVCDDTCREVVLDQSSGTLVCTISGHCFDRWLSPDEETDTDVVCTLQPPPPSDTHAQNDTTPHKTTSPPLMSHDTLPHFANHCIFRISSKPV